VPKDKQYKTEHPFHRCLLFLSAVFPSAQSAHLRRDAQLHTIDKHGHLLQLATETQSLEQASAAQCRPMGGYFHCERASAVLCVGGPSMPVRRPPFGGSSDLIIVAERAQWTAKGSALARRDCSRLGIWCADQGEIITGQSKGSGRAKGARRPSGRGTGGQIA